ncbi:MAG: ATP-binding cassette domain-containing protein [Fibrobacteres bacterium]|nr:ATP-binding cassette domain-containing protein [Fibrobacterota bacterium]
MIKVENLKKTYGTMNAVNDISFEIDRGEIVGFLGPNGAGKTTTMKILTGFIGSTSGTASIAGHDVETASLDVRRRVGYMPESSPLYTDMDVLGYLKFIAEVREIDPGLLSARLDSVATTCGLKQVLRKPISQLSKGYKQRVGLAQAIIHDPEVLILDEPTSGLDPNQIIEIRELIRKLGKEKTVVLSTHILPEVEAVCSRAIIINKGNIVAQGSISELTASAHETVSAKIRGDKSAIEAGLRAIDGIQSAICKGGVNGFNNFEIVPVKGHSVAESVFRFAADKGFSMCELKTEGASLEDVFTRLTRSVA